MSRTRYEPHREDFQTVLNRNEPCNIIHVIEVIAGLKGISTHKVAKATWENTLRLFNIKPEGSD